VVDQLWEGDAALQFEMKRIRNQRSEVFTGEGRNDDVLRDPFQPDGWLPACASAGGWNQPRYTVGADHHRVFIVGNQNITIALPHSGVSKWCSILLLASPPSPKLSAPVG